MFTTMPILLEADGSYDDLAMFLSKVATEVNADFSEVVLFEPPPSTETGKPGLLHLTLKLDVYLHFEGTNYPWDIKPKTGP